MPPCVMMVLVGVPTTGVLGLGLMKVSVVPLADAPAVALPLLAVAGP